MNIEIKNISFTSRKYLAWKKDISIKEITNKTMYDEGYGKVYGYINNNKIEVTGAGSVLYFRWNNPEGRASIAIAAPVEHNGIVSHPELSIVDVPESKAVSAELRGSYDGLMKVHESIVNYLNEHKINSVLTIEEYTVDPSKEPDPANWVTNVFYLYN